jgi:hypothetical protein
MIPIADNEEVPLDEPMDEEMNPEEQMTQDDTQNPEAEAPEDPDDEEIDSLLLKLMEEAEKEDEDIRYRLLLQWRRNDLYFNNIQKIFYDFVARDFRSVDSAMSEMEKAYPSTDTKIINIYRAYVESMVAALSVNVPAVEFLPDDAEDGEDNETAEAYSRISELIEKHCKTPLLQIKALITLFNCGTIFGYNYYKTDPSYGTYKSPKSTENRPVQVSDIRCPKCAELLDSNVPTDIVQSGSQVICKTCGYVGQPAIYQRLTFVEEVVEYEETPKGRIGLDVFGPNYVKVPLYARDQANIPYLILRLEEHLAKLKTVYHENADDITAGGGDTYRYERWSRIPIDYLGTIPQDLTTARYGWFRPWWYNVLQKEDADKLMALYPNGVMITVIGDIVVEKKHDKLDDCWTATFDPRTNFIHAEAAGNSLIPIQDAKNDTFNLGLQSIEYGIPETFANPKTLNLQKYSESAAAPGMMSPALPPGPDKSLADGFHTIKTATLSNEYVSFDKGLDGLAQFVSGALPSIWGGSNEKGSKTADEYRQSRAMALQRLQITWKMFTEFYSSLIAKSVRMYADNLREDERFAKKENGTFVNVWIRKSSLNGKVGHIEPEASDQLPLSWAQKKDFVMGLIELQNPEIGAILLHPNNADFLKKATGIPEFYIPGERDRDKQYAEFYKLSQGQPMGNQPSIPIDVVVDDHPVHMQVLKNILVGPVGMSLYETNPAGYQNCIAHYRMHEFAQQAKTMNSSGVSMPGQPAESATKTTQG